MKNIHITMRQWHRNSLRITCGIVILTVCTQSFLSSTFSTHSYVPVPARWLMWNRPSKSNGIFVTNADMELDVKLFRERRKDVLSNHQEVDILRRTLDTLDYPTVLTHLAKHCQTEVAKELIIASPDGLHSSTEEYNENDNDYPLTAPDFQGVIDRFDALREYDELCRLNQKAPSISSNLNIRPILASAESGSILECDDIREIARALKAISLTYNWLREVDKLNKSDNDNIQENFVHIPRLGRNLYVDEDLRLLLETAFDTEGELSSSSFPELGKLRKEVAIMRKQILSRVESMLKSSQFSSMLEGKYFSEVNGRFVLPVQATHKNTVGIVHDSSRTGKTVYVEPKEVIEPTNDMKQKELLLKQEETRILRSLSSKIMKNREDIELSVS